MLSLGVLLYSFFPGPQHMIHGIYYLLRSLITKDVKCTLEHTSFDIELPPRWGDVWICIVTLLLTLPRPQTDDFVFVPYIVIHTMGYGAPVWLTVIGGALFTVYVIIRPNVLFLCTGAVLSRYLTGENRQLGLIFAGIAHLLMAFFEPINFSFLSVCTVLFMAEAKLRLKWDWELVPPVYNVILSGPLYIMNLFIWGWAHTWKYTDKVWKNPDIIFPILNIATGIYLQGTI